MSIYRFSDGSLIAEIRFHVPAALLATAGNADPAKLISLRHAMEAQGWQCVPIFAEGKEQLQVSGFKDTASFIELLRSKGAIEGTPYITAETVPEDKEPSDKNFLQRHSLQLAGILNLIGDIGFLGRGIKDRDKHTIAGGALYTLGGLNLALFGRVKPNENMNAVSKDMADFIKQKTGNVAEGTALAGIADHANEKTQKFLYRNAASNTLVAYLAGASAILASGIKKYRIDPKDRASMDYGIASVAIKTASLLIPEKRKKAVQEDESAKGGFISRSWNWIREKPLRIFGYGSLITETLLTRQAYKEYLLAPNAKKYYWTALTAGTYITADLLAAISNKDPANADRFTPEDQRHIEAMAAEAITRVPETMRAELIQQTAGFLAAQPQMRGKAEEISASLEKQVAHIEQNPWVSRVASRATSPQPSLKNI